VFGWGKKPDIPTDDRPPNRLPPACCDGLKEAFEVQVPATPLFRLEDNGLLYLAVGCMQVEGGRLGWLESAVLFCPFCGKPLQTPEQIQQAAKQTP
jgi:hypothetical protein